MSDTNSMVAADNNTDLIASESETGGAEEQKSGFSATLGNVDVLRQITLVVALTICLAIAIFVIILANEPDYRVLSKLPTAQLIKTMDFLDANKVEYNQHDAIKTSII